MTILTWWLQSCIRFLFNIGRFIFILTLRVNQEVRKSLRKNSANRVSSPTWKICSPCPLLPCHMQMFVSFQSSHCIFDIIGSNMVMKARRISSVLLKSYMQCRDRKRIELSNDSIRFDSTWAESNRTEYEFWQSRSNRIEPNTDPVESNRIEYDPANSTVQRHLFTLKRYWVFILILVHFNLITAWPSCNLCICE